MDITFNNPGLIKNLYKIICFDMDGTLIRGTTANLFYAKLLGVEDEVIGLEKKFKAGQIESQEFALEVSNIMSGLTVDFVRENFDMVPVVDGIGETIELLNKLGIITVIATTSNRLFAECLQAKYGFQYIYGTEHKVFPDGRIGAGEKICSGAHKLLCIQELAKKYKCPMKKVIAVGDSVSDLPIFSGVGYRIAFNYDDVMLDKADTYIRSDTLTTILINLGGNSGYRQKKSV